MAQNVKVYCRVRPLLPREKISGAKPCISVNTNEENGERPYVRIGDRSWSFEGVFDANSKQIEIFDLTVAPLVVGCLSGYNATVLAYGQTGSGKTFTMGTADTTVNTDTHQPKQLQQQQRQAYSKIDPLNPIPTTIKETAFNYYDGSDDDGIIPRAMKSLFELIEEKRIKGVKIELKVSYLEILNEEIRDLFASSDAASKLLAVREDNYRRISVPNAILCQASNLQTMLNLFREGGSRRTTAGTLMNAVSSRSHAIFTVFIEQFPVSGDGRRVRSKFHLVDLAGSERLQRTGATGSRQRESAAINQGLLALSKVISALTVKLRVDDTRHQHIPYRDSKLTRLLQDSLGGNSATCVVACVSPADDSIGETVNTLKYASKARLIVNAPVVNEVDDEEIMRENERARQEQIRSNHGHHDQELKEEEDDDDDDEDDTEGGQWRKKMKKFKEMEMMLIQSQEQFIQLSSCVKHLKTMVQTKYGTIMQQKHNNHNHQHQSHKTAKEEEDDEERGIISIIDNAIQLAEQGTEIYNKHSSTSSLNNHHQSPTDKCLKLAMQLKEREKDLEELRQQNSLLKDDLSRDEEIFADKLKEIKSLQSENCLLKKQLNDQQPSHEGAPTQTEKQESEGTWQLEDIEDNLTANPIANPTGTENHQSINSQPGSTNLDVGMEDVQGNNSARRQRKKWNSNTQSRIVCRVKSDEVRGVKSGDDKDQNDDFENGYHRNSTQATELSYKITKLEAELLESEAELLRLIDDSHEGDKAVKEAQNNENILQFQIKDLISNKNEMIINYNQRLEQIDQFKQSLIHENEILNSLIIDKELMVNKIKQFENDRIEDENDDDDDETIILKQNNSENYSTDKIGILSELEHIENTRKSHQQAIQALELSGEEATELVLRYRNRVVNLQNEVASLRAELLKESDLKLHQSSVNTSRKEMDLSKDRISKLKELLSARTMELRTLALQENEQKQVLNLKKESDSKILSYKNEIKKLNKQIKNNKEILSKLETNSNLNLNDKNDKNKIKNQLLKDIENIEIKIKQHQKKIFNLKKNLNFNENDLNVIKNSLENIDTQIINLDLQLNDCIKMIKMTEKACLIIEQNIKKYETKITCLKTELIELKKQLKETSEFFNDSQKRSEHKLYDDDDVLKQDVFIDNDDDDDGWRNDSEDDDEDDKDNDDDQLNKCREAGKNNSTNITQDKGRRHKRASGWISRQLLLAEQNILAMKQHGRDVTRRSLAQSRYEQLENERDKVLKSHNQLRNSHEAMEGAILLRSSLEEVSATIKALDAQVAITNATQRHSQSFVDQLGSESIRRRRSGVGESISSMDRLSNKMEELLERREEAMQRRSSIEQAMHQSEVCDELQQIDDELYALEAEIDLKDKEINTWRMKQTLNSICENDSLIKDDDDDSNGGINGIATIENDDELLLIENVNEFVIDQLHNDDDKEAKEKNNSKNLLGINSKFVVDCLRCCSVKCLQSKLALEKTKLLLQDARQSAKTYENELSLVSLAVKTEKDQTMVLNKKLKSLSYNLKRIRNERNQLRAFLNVMPNNSNNIKINQDQISVKQNDEIYQNQSSFSPTKSHSHTELKTRSNVGLNIGNKDDNGEGGKMRRVRVSAKELQEMSDLQELTPTINENIHRSKWNRESQMKARLSEAPSPPLRAAPPRPST